MNGIASTDPPSSSTLSISSCARSSISSVSASMKYEPANGSTVSAAPDSAATICCVRSAILADFSLGSASASSKPFVCSDCVQPHRRLRRVDVVPAGDVLLEHVVLRRAAQLVRRDALLLGHELVQEQED